MWLLIAAVSALACVVIWLSLSGRGASLTLLALVVVALLAWVADRRGKRAANWLKGARSEVAVGDVLAELVRDGYTVMHDIPQVGEGNVDHLVSGPGGVYLIETKHRWYELDDLRKAKRQAKKLHGGLGVWVTPVVCLDQRHGRPYHRNGVWIVCREDVCEWLKTQRNAVLPFERLADFADRLPSS